MPTTLTKCFIIVDRDETKYVLKYVLFTYAIFIIYLTITECDKFTVYYKSVLYILDNAVR